MKLIDFISAFNEYMDVGNQTYVYGKQMEVVINLALQEFISTRDSDIESQRRKDDLHRYIKRKLFYNVSIIDRNDLEDYFKLDAINCKFNFECDGVIYNDFRPCKPNTIDEYTQNKMDPDNRAEDFFPVYIMVDFKFEIKSDTIPLETEVLYKRNPIKVDINKEDSELDIDESNIPDLIKIAARIAFDIIESERYPNAVKVENPIINN